MRTLVIILAGFALWALCLGVAKVVSGSTRASVTAATAIFVALWFVAAAVNLWVGVARAGYSFFEELPIFLVIFLLPACAALFSQRRAR
jgi:hypothetical protein